MIHKKEFYFVRHGQTDDNAAKIKVEHHHDFPLNHNGLKQALAIEPVIATLPVKSVCYSPLKRAKETKEIITPQINAKHHEISALSECNLQVWTDMTACGVNAYESSHTHVRTFIEQALKGINEALSCEGPVLVVAHGGIHFAICCAMAITDHDWVIDNCVPVHFFVGTTGEWKAKKLL